LSCWLSHVVDDDIGYVLASSVGERSIVLLFDADHIVLSLDAIIFFSVI
jgi:hypothetical protein